MRFSSLFAIVLLAAPVLAGCGTLGPAQGPTYSRSYDQCYTDFSGHLRCRFGFADVYTNGAVSAPPIVIAPSIQWPGTAPGGVGPNLCFVRGPDGKAAQTQCRTDGSAWHYFDDCTPVFSGFQCQRAVEYNE